MAERRAGASLYAIKDRLNADGIKGSGGGHWYAATVRHALLVAEREARSDPAKADGHADHPSRP